MTGSLRIGIDTHAISSGHATGYRTYIAELVQHLIALDTEHHFVLYAVEHNSYYQQFSGNPHVTVRHVFSPNGFVRHFISLPRAVKQDNLDIVNLHFFRPLTLSVPVVLTVHDLYYLHMLKPGWREKVLGRLTLWSIPRVNHIITCSEYSRTDIMQRTHIPADKATTVLLGVTDHFSVQYNPAAVTRLRHQLGIRDEYVLFVGRTEDKRKNVLSLVEAFAALKAEGATKAQLVIAGRHGQGTAQIQARMHELGLGNEILLPGIIADADLPILFSGAAAFVYVSSFEGFGLPVVEAMAAGAPVITANTTSLPEVAGDAAILVTPGNQQELQEALRHLLNNPDLQQQLRTKGYLRARTFTWKRAAHKVLETLVTTALQSRR